ncbi:MAG: hypothetical protein WBD17_01625 [Candidatus Omnitrophota bacterium]
MKDEKFEYKGVGVILRETGGKWVCICDASEEIKKLYPKMPRTSKGWFETKEKARENAKSEIDRLLSQVK